MDKPKHIEYYEFLGISVAASPSEIKRAYYKRALELHPDKNPGNEEAKASFQHLTKVYAVLSVPAKRFDYDNYGEDEEDDGGGEEADEDIDIPDELTVEQIKAFIAAMGIAAMDCVPPPKPFTDHMLAPEDLKAMIEFQSTMDPSFTYTKDILESEIARAEGIKLATLEFPKKGIKQLPDSIGNLTTLRKLGLDNNKLSTLPLTISHLAGLRFLNLSVNQFTVFPEVILQLSLLQELYLEHNKIKVIPEGISALAELTKVSFFANSIETLPASLSKLPNLKKLDLEINFIKTIPAELEPMLHIMCLDPTVGTPTLGKRTKVVTTPKEETRPTPKRTTRSTREPTKRATKKTRTTRVKGEDNTTKKRKRKEETSVPRKRIKK